MAVLIQDSNLNPRNFVNITSRYINNKVIYYSENNLITFSIYRRTPSVKTARDLVTVITPRIEYRPDLLSYEVYGTPDNWWKILEMNNIKDVFDFKAGLSIRLPQSIF